jgi:hypothetical protein
MPRAAQHALVDIFLAEHQHDLRSVAGRSVSVFANPSTDDDDLPDLDIDAAGAFLCDPPLSRRTMYRLAKEGRVETYRILGRRIFKRASLKRRRDEFRAEGPQLLEPPRLTGAKRKPGRPKTKAAAGTNGGAAR